MGKNLYASRKSTYNFGPKNEIKEVLDEGADENGLKINLNLCPSLEDDMAAEYCNSLAPNAMSVDAKSGASSSSFDYDTIKSNSPKYKKKRRKCRKMTTNDFTKRCRIIGSPLQKLADNKHEYKDEDSGFKNFEWNITSNSNVDICSNKSPGGNDSGDETPLSEIKINKARSENGKKKHLDNENMMSIIDSLKALESQM